MKYGSNTEGKRVGVVKGTETWKPEAAMKGVDRTVNSTEPELEKSYIRYIHL